MTLTTTKGTYTGTISELADRLAELVPSHADLDGVEVEVPVPDETASDEEWAGACMAALVATTATTIAVRSHDTWTVADTSGGRWWPSDETSEEIEASADPEETALRICRETPSRGTWHS